MKKYKYGNIAHHEGDVFIKQLNEAMASGVKLVKSGVTGSAVNGIVWWAITRWEENNE